jgi:hypothetical protein
MTPIRVLHLSETKVTDAGLRELAGLARLEELSISKCRGITDAGLVHLGSFPALRVVDVMVTGVTQEGARRALKKFPADVKARLTIVVGPTA